LNEEKSKYASLAQENGFGSAKLLCLRARHEMIARF
jgi:hypothetical protein